MTVYIQGYMLPEAFAGLVPAEVTAVHEYGVDLRLEDGVRLIDWRAKLYDQYETEIPLDQVRRDFASEQAKKDPDLRLAALEAELAAYEAAYMQGVQEA